MKELKELTVEERTLITIGCEPFYISYKQDNKLKFIHTKLMEFFPQNHKKEVWVFITSAINPVKFNLSGSLFSLRKGDYTTANSRHGLGVSYVKCKRVIEKLDEEGFIDLYKGFYDHNTNTSLKSCYIIKQKLLDLFDNVDMVRVGRPRPVETFVELRDPETDELITELSKLRGIKDKRDLVKRYNTLLSTFDIRCKSHPVCAIYKRVFTGDLTRHGRWYSQSCLQTTRSVFRKYITIGGVKTTEVDFRQMHPRILMTLDKVYKPMSWEPYADISDITKDMSYGKESRLLSKFAMMCLLNAKNQRAAKSALFKIYSDDQSKEGDRMFDNLKLEKGVITEIFKRLIHTNKEISHWFGKKDLWAILQHYDSEIAAYIIEKFTNLGKCILPWHDSFVVCIQDRDLLINTMREAWLHVMGDTRNCFYDIEY